MNKIIREIIVGVASGAAYEAAKCGCKRGIDALQQYYANDQAKAAAARHRYETDPEFRR